MTKFGKHSSAIFLLFSMVKIDDRTFSFCFSFFNLIVTIS